MAKRNSTSKIARARKKGSKRAESPPHDPRPAKRAESTSTERDPFEDFGGERATLMKAEAVLACLSVSLNYLGWSGDDGTLHAVAADVARDLVAQSMSRLEERDRQIEASRRRPN